VGQGKTSQSYLSPVVVQMSGRSEESNAMSGGREHRRRALRELVINAADAARKTREKAVNATLGRAASRAVRERVALFLAGVDRAG